MPNDEDVERKNTIARLLRDFTPEQLARMLYDEYRRNQMLLGTLELKCEQLEAVVAERSRMGKLETL